MHTNCTTSNEDGIAQCSHRGDNDDEKMSPSKPMSPTDESLAHQLYALCQALDRTLSEHYERCVTPQISRVAMQTTHDALHFTIKRSTPHSFSHLQCVSGVAVTEGVIRKNCICALYPGTVYLVGDPAYSRTIANPFIFRCDDGCILDASELGMSKLVYKSCSFRARHGSQLCSDQTWLTSSPVMPLAHGHHVRCVDEDDKASPPNCAYRVLDVPLEGFDMRYRKYIPNVMYRTEGVDYIKLVVIVATRDIEEGAELLVCKRHT